VPGGKPRYRFLRVAVAVVLVAPLVASFLAAVGAAETAADPFLAPQPLVLEAPPGATSVSGSVRLTSSRHLRIGFLPRGLLRTSDDAEASLGPSPTAPPFSSACALAELCVDASAIKVDPVGLELTPNLSAQIVVTISGVARPGTYVGAIDVVAVEVVEASPSPRDVASSPPAMEEVLDLRLVVQSSLALALPDGVTTVTARRVRIDGPIDKVLAWALLSDAEGSDDLVVPAVNGGQDPVRVAPAIVAVGQHTQIELPESAVAWSTDVTLGQPCVDGARVELPPTGHAALRACLTPSAIPADRYVGAIELAAAGGAEQRIPIDLTIRAGPGLALLWILIGIGLGLLANVLVDRAFPAAGLLDQLRALGRRTSAMQAQDQAPLHRLLGSARATLDGSDIEGGRLAVAHLTAAVRVTEQLEQFEAEHVGVGGGTLTLIRRLLKEDLIDEADHRLKGLRLATAEATPLAAAAAAAGEEAYEAPPGAPTRARAQSLVKWAFIAAVTVAIVVVAAIGFLAGLPPAALLLVGVIALLVIAFAERRALVRFARAHWLPFAGLLRPVVWFVTVLGLTIVGLETLYVADAARLIAAPIDPLVIFAFWGLGSDVAGRTILNFAKPA